MKVLRPEKEPQVRERARQISMLGTRRMHELRVPFGPRRLRVGKAVPPCALGEMDGWGRTVQIGAWSPAADTERADPAPWLHRQRSRTDVGLSSTTSPKSARRGRRMVTLLLAIFSPLRALGAIPTDPLDVMLRGRTSPCRSSP